MSEITRKYLIGFEEEAEKLFLDKKILAPIHLSDGNEEELIGLFKSVNKEDWVFSTWRSHYHALLHGIPREEVMRQIKAGNSMAINSDNPKFFSSAIVGSTCPIALGAAMEIKRRGDKNQVWCFIGDMAAETGIYNECLKYALNFDLPITYVVEDNGVSVGADTRDVWGWKTTPQARVKSKNYSYTKNKYPHVGAGQFVTF